MYTSPIRLIAVDLDGTVLNDRKQLTPRTAAALTEAAARGVEIVPATGRPTTGLPAELLALPGVRYAITSNGARTADLASGRAIRNYLPLDKALAAYDILQRYDCMADLFQDGKGYTTRANQAAVGRFAPENLRDYVLRTRTPLPDLRAFIASQERGIEKLTIFFLDEAERQRAWAELMPLGVDAVSGMPLNLEITAAGVSKGSALLALAERLGLPASALMACGDGGNDTAMVAAAGLGVAMANAFPEVKAAARYVTASNNEDGVARAVETFVLGKEAL